MSNQEVPPSLRSIFADVLEISPDEVTAGTDFSSVENWDSFRHLQLILAIEDEFRVQFDPQRIPDLTSVAALQAELLKKGVSF